MSNIIFFPRNEVHQKFYLEIALKLNSKHKIFILHEKLEHKVSENVSFVSYENKVLNNIKTIKGNSWKKKLEEEFLLDTKNNFLYYEREFNFFPGYFGYKRFSYEHQCKYLYSLYTILPKIIKKCDPRFVISELINGLPDAVIHDLSEKLKFQYISLRPAKISNGVIFCNPDNDTPIDLGINKFKVNKNIANQIISNIENSVYFTPEYMELTKKNFKFLKLSRIKTLINRFEVKRNYFNKNGLYRYPVMNPARYFFKKTKNKFFFSFYRELFQSYNEIKDENYIFFPLHYEPESSTMVRAFNWSDQLSLIKLLSRQIPPPYVLLLKEHIGNDGFRDNHFYKEVSYLPNVKLISKEENPYQIISNSKGVICLTGRAGFESFVLEKSVAVFGEVFYQDWPHAKKINSLHEFKDWVLSLKKDKNVKIPSLTKKKFVTNYLSNVYDFKFVIGLNSTMEKENIDKMVYFFNQLLSDVS